jgi:REP element-mobilizing transposase RayT
VHWTLTVEDRATGWLGDSFHHRWQLCLLHACARFRLLCPAYVLMPDHMHLIWTRYCGDSDQLRAIEFFRKQLRPALLPATWQKQAHDHVLGEEERKREAFIQTANYVLENPVRAGLVANYADYPYVGSCIPGYPDVEIRAPDYWERFWRIYNYLLTAPPARAPGSTGSGQP